MILPVFALYAEDLAGATPLLVGLAIGAYGLTQALFQIPFGMLSDRFGRKPVIGFGLLLFALGSVVAATSDSVVGMIVGRALQGSGAIAAAVMALAADLTREEHRARVMAVIGMSIGLSFALSLVLGPVLAEWLGLQGIFWVTTGLALAGLLVLAFAVPSPRQSIFHLDAETKPAYFSDVLANRQLLRLDAGVFVLHMMLTASFVVLPFALRDNAGLPGVDHWQVYLPVLLLSLFIMVPLVVIAEKYRRIKQVFTAAIACLAVAQLGLFLFYDSLMGIFLTLLLFFLAFNVLEALLPSLVAKFSPADRKGTAMGLYSTSQFLGAFVGGIIGGALHGWHDIEGVFMFCMLAALAWLAWARTMQTPRYLTNYLLHVGSVAADQQATLRQRLLEVAGVAEVTLVAEEGAAYLKIDSRTADMAALEAFSVANDGNSVKSHRDEAGELANATE